MKLVYVYIVILFFMSWFSPGFKRAIYGISDGDIFQCIPIGDLVGHESIGIPTWRVSPSISLDRYKRSVPISLIVVGTWPTAPWIESFDGSIRVEASNRSNYAKQRFSIEASHTCSINTVPKRLPRTELDLRYSDALYGTQRIVRKEHMEIKLTPPGQFEDTKSHEYAIVQLAGAYIGTRGHVSVWQPYVREKDFSLAQVWVTSVDTEGNLISIEASWQVYNGLYGDSMSRLFVYWTSDTYKTTGCNNLKCKGFVQLNSKWMLGGAFSTVSDSEIQYELNIQIFQDRATRDWWLQINGEYLGYWPNSLFGRGSFDGSDTTIHWRGEIIHDRLSNITDTEMGNGVHPSATGKAAAYIRKLQVVNWSGYLVDPHSRLTPFATYPECCGVRIPQGLDDESPPSWGAHFYFGGPGFNQSCVDMKYS